MRSKDNVRRNKNRGSDNLYLQFLRIFRGKVVEWLGDYGHSLSPTKTLNVHLAIMLVHGRFFGVVVKCSYLLLHLAVQVTHNHQVEHPLLEYETNHSQAQYVGHFHVWFPGYLQNQSTATGQKFWGQFNVNRCGDISLIISSM